MKKKRGKIVTDKILDTAERLFYEQGYNITGINQVIEESDIAKASLYKHFNSKTDLLLAYLQRIHENWYNGLENSINQIGEPKQRLLAIFDYHMERQSYRKHGGCPFIKANDEAGLCDVRILPEIQKAKHHLKEFIEKQVVDSDHKKLLTNKELADLIFLTLEGGIVSASVFKHTDDLQIGKKIIQKLI